MPEEIKKNKTADLKLNTSAYRVLTILLLLIRNVRDGGLTMPEVNRALHADTLIARAFNSETLTKYFNTLRYLGCDIPRASSKTDYRYMLATHPFPLTIQPRQLALAEALGAFLHHQPDGTLAVRYRKFMQRLYWATNHTSAGQAKTGEGQADLKAVGVVATHRHLLGRYREFCRDGQMLHVLYKENDRFGESNMIMEPGRVVQEGKKLFLLGVDTDSKNNVKINLHHILQASQLPMKTRNGNRETTVVFQLYGRLAASYRLYSGEEVLFRQEETLQVKTRTDNPETLLGRLRKYGTSCQVISPQSLRKGMGQQLETLRQTLLAANDSEAGPEKTARKSVQAVGPKRVQA